MNHPVLVIGFLMLAVWCEKEDSFAQVTGELAEMDRLEQRADELAAQADAEGAALAAGKAAMMADILTKETQEPSSQSLFRAASLLYRAQERGLRALALFERAGGTPPASAGVCHFLFQGEQKLRDSKDLLEKNPLVFQDDLQRRSRHVLGKIGDWELLFEGMNRDFLCPDTSPEVK